MKIKGLVSYMFFSISLLVWQGPVLSAQENDEEVLLENTLRWNRELFSLPLHFAPGLPFRGTEEALFPRGWRTPESSCFWTYAFAWQIESSSLLQATELENALQLYFDGLMAVVSTDSTVQRSPTLAVMVEEYQDMRHAKLKGKVLIFDAFATQQPLLLFASVEQYLTPGEQQLIVLFRFSPQHFFDEVWLQLKAIKLRWELLPQTGIAE